VLHDERHRGQAGLGQADADGLRPLDAADGLVRIPAVTLALSLLLVAGCGSSSSNGWKDVSKRKASGTALGAVAGPVANRTSIRVRVESKPNVATQVSYSIDCAKGRHTVTGVTSGHTPFTATIPLPTSNPAS